jgi:hypothetical protein
VSFFDDGDDAIEEEPRRRARPSSTARPRGGSGGSRSGSPRGPSNPAVERRRLGAIAVLVVVVILVILLISSCQARDTKNSLEDYNNSVSSLITRSDATGSQVFKILGSGKGGSTISSNLAGPLQNADTQLTDAKDLSVPDQMSQAQSNVVLALQMRADGISVIANHVAQVSGSGTATNTALATIATGTARFYASDVIYKAYAVNEIAAALNGDNLHPGGNSNIQINGGQFLTDLGWLQTSFIGTKLGATSSSAVTTANESQPGLHGDALNSVSVGANTLSTAGTNTVDGSPAPTFTLSVSNGGAFNEYEVGCTVSVEGGPSGKGTISEITPGSTDTCNVKLNSTVPAGTYQVTVTVDKVPLETNLANNVLTYSIQFQ